MLSKGMVLIFVIECIAGAILACFERPTNWAMLVYFTGGAILNAGLLMVKGG